MMLMRAGQVWLVALVMVSVLVGSSGVPEARAGARAGHSWFAALDGGHAVVPRVLVTALTVAPSHTIYAGGAYVVRNTDPTAGSPVHLLGSVWLVSHDHGATWTERVSTTNPNAFPQSGVAPWRDRTMWPIDFTPAGITVDPHNPRVMYAAGCTDSGNACQSPVGGPMVVRSPDGGRTWQTALSLKTIVMSPAYRAAIRLSGAVPTEGYAVVVDPRTSRRVYAAVSGLGVLRSEDGGRSWMYVTQPQSNRIGKPCELVLDPKRPDTVYELAREGVLYRTIDAGRRWTVVAELGAQTKSTVSSLTLVGRTLYVTAAKGIYTSKDGGMHWRLAYPAPIPGSFVQSVRGVAGWISTFGPANPHAMSGLYAVRDGETWWPAADTDTRGPQSYGSLDFRAMDADLATRLWEDHGARIVFTAGGLGGLYRWQSSL